MSSAIGGRDKSTTHREQIPKDSGAGERTHHGAMTTPSGLDTLAELVHGLQLWRSRPTTVTTAQLSNWTILKWSDGPDERCHTSKDPYFAHR